ncbi:MAG: DUF4445 domain-containing protein [Lachnospiraceae bacterium]|uniref:DUF4445 domain-containing protein n=1 Tax=Candidatus Weimeria bifida TaxID=2599074 RepID=A0A6N7J174_9FIRM|nr:DUF4445 domain-containing protein [Candidatus Weimeria bifida]RRF96546.1 MAG: DUF4445 domain-containing protein [Lachnospiraceae bacterium]
MIKEFRLDELNSGDKTVADFLRKHEIRLILPCGGTGVCGKCSVKVLFFHREKILKTFDFPACQYTMDKLLKSIPAGSDCIRFDIPEDSVIKSQKLHQSASDGRPYLAAVDLGSTTIETAALSLDGEVIGSERCRNPQVSYGADVISRIKAASESMIAASDMQRLAESTIRGSLEKLSARYSLAGLPEKIAIAGNTTMGHLLDGQDVSPLGQAPFDPGDISLKDISKVFFTDKRPVILLPGISTYVGGDITSGIFDLDIDRSDKPQMLIDLGTNGEMALGDRNGIWVTSTAAGPAFEAANISCGVPGIPGAVKRVTFKGQTAHLTLIPWDKELSKLPPGVRMQEELRLRAKRPAGICGSGLISAVSGMKKAGIIDDTGAFTSDEWRKYGFKLWKPSPATRGESPVVITQDDIHELLLAKSAVRSGIEILIRSYGTTPEKIFLAGGFGSALTIEDAVSIGIFPEELSSHIVAAGNTSLKGAIKFLKNDSDETRHRLAAIKNLSHEIVLGDDSDFEDLFIRHMSF